jgi:segregation and condensation protein A
MYRIKLPNFEGPFDLLLYFIHRDELDIYDIPISKITEEFLSYIKLMQQFDIELAGEFIVMASTLMYIKSQMLLPRPKTDENGDEIEDPRTELVERLLEYKQIKESAAELREMKEDQKYHYYRNIFDSDINEVTKNSNFKNATLFDLIKAFKKITERQRDKELRHIVDVEASSVEEKSKYILNLINTKKRISFFWIVKNNSKLDIVVTFLSLLDLIRNHSIYMFQKENFDDIIIAQTPVNENNLKEENES